MPRGGDILFTAKTNVLTVLRAAFITSRMELLLAAVDITLKLA